MLSNFSIEKQLDYTLEESEIVGLFENYLTSNDFVEAEDFIKTQLAERPNSILINYYYARYLKERKRDFNQAIVILEHLRVIWGNHPSILRQLFTCYISQAIPNYDKASVYVTQLEKLATNNDELRLDIAEFYIKWSTSIKVRQAPNLDPLDEGIRQLEYKDLAKKGIEYLNGLENTTHRVYYLFAQGYSNLWKYETAETMIDRAISLLDGPSNDLLSNYRSFKRHLHGKEGFWSSFNSR
jgi:hypothetical protein